MKMAVRKQELIYKPLLENFCNDVKIYRGKINISGLFLANAMENYESSKHKCFYIGQDTYWWTDFDNMIDLCLSGKAHEYINKNNKWLSTQKIISQSSNNAGSFWTMVIRLHIYLKTNELVNVNNLNKDQVDMINDMGWGNLNSIEIPRTLQNEERWNDINESDYWDIKKKSVIFDRIKLILDIYNPDTMFIFNWCDDTKTEQVLDGLEVEWNEKTYIQNIISTYKIKGYNTHLIWGSHPNNLKWQGTNINNTIEIIKKVYDER
jgi:hypothetical protein